jgi:site-specific DNA-methyltransferase (adenine-specific)
MIQPYASGRNWRLYRGDCLHVLTELLAAGVKVDATVTDAPYSSGGMVRGDRTGGSARKKYANSDSKIADQLTGFSGDNRDQRSFLLWCSLWLGLCLDLVEEGSPIVSFIDWRQLPTMTDAIQSGGWVWRGIVPWCKPGARPQMGRFSAAAEYAVWGTAGPSADLIEVGCLPGYYLLDDGTPIAEGADPLPALIEESPPPAATKNHLTEKPVAVMRPLVRVCRPGGVVLDPFCGSGATGVGALLEGRGFVGIEREVAHLDTTARRLADVEAGVPERRAALGKQAGLFERAAG